MNPLNWYIRNISNPILAWNSMWGWVEVEHDDDVTTFNLYTDQDKEQLNLPLEGEWAVL